MTLDMRLLAYEPNGPLIGPLPGCTRINAMFAKSEPGSIEFDYPKQGPLASLLNGWLEVAVEVSHDGSPFVEPNNGRFLLLGSDGDGMAENGTPTFSGPSYHFRLSKAVVTQGNGTLKEGRRFFAKGSTAGGIMKALASEAQSRGALEGCDFSSFSATTDSAGQPWSRSTEISYDLGLDLMTVLLNLIDQGLVTARWAGRSLYLYNDFGHDYSTGNDPVILRTGRDFTEAPERTDGTEMATHAYARGDEARLAVASAAANPAPWGRWETTVNQGGVSDTNTLTSLALKAAERASGLKREAGRGIVFADGSPLPFRDYGISDYILSDTGSGPEKMRVYQLTLMRDDKAGLSGAIVMNDAIRDADITIARKVNGILGGSTAGGASPALPAQIALIKVQPTEPEGPVGTAWLDTSVAG